VGIANELGMSPTTAHRYVSTLARLGYLVQGAGRKYRLALRVTELGMSAMSRTSLQEHARPYIMDQREHTGFTVVIAVLDGPEVLLVDCLRGNRRGQGRTGCPVPGTRLPAHCTATGKLLLAYLPEREQHRAISELKLARHAPNTIVNKSALRAELQGIHDAGLAAANEELAPGMYSIAAPVRSGSRDTVAAVGMDAHTSVISLGELVDALGPHLVSTADRISARLGYRRDDELPDPRVSTLALAEESRR
jgi:IclR family pca regulon transcriptional regulator